MSQNNQNHLKDANLSSDLNSNQSKSHRVFNLILWFQSLKVYLEAPSLRMLILGFSAGLPATLVGATLSFRLSEAGINIILLGLVTLIGLVYSFKWIWSPFVDSLAIPWFTRRFGRRRSWLLISQIGIILGLLGIGFINPQSHLNALIALSIWVAFHSATQDIALDAYRIESATPERQAALAASYVAGYRIAILWAGAGALKLASYAESTKSPALDLALSYQNHAWIFVYMIMAISMLFGFVTVLFSPEPAYSLKKDQQENESRNQNDLNNPWFIHFKKWFVRVIIHPFSEFFLRYRWHALLILSLISIYRISDIVMGAMAAPFYVSMGYTKDEIANISKVFGVIMTLLGGFIGGLLTVRLGVMRTLMLGAILSSASNLLFAWLSMRGHDVQGLIWVISIDNLSGGIATTAFIAYLSSLTNIQYSATQYTLFSSLMTLLPKFLGASSGFYVISLGYFNFFILTALLGVPVLILIALASKIQVVKKDE